MEFMYKHAYLPKDKRLLMNINSASKRLCDKLESLDIEAMEISDYNKVYFGERKSNLTESLQLYSYILAWSLAESKVPLNKFVFLDYGGGSGMLSLLAKELNIGTVIYNDIYDISCRDAEIIGKLIGNEADYYIQGDIDNVINYLKAKSLSCNAIASYDVIEHVYDIEMFLKKLRSLSNGSLTVCMSSGANIFNPLIKNSLMNKQVETEYKDREKKFGHKERDCTKSYIKARKEIILEYLSKNNKKLPEIEVDKLAKTSRGMMDSDIKKCVEIYLKTGQFPREPDHPTNTCDPYTGNWAEHLMNPYDLIEILSTSGFKVKMLSGYYGSHRNVIKEVIRRSLNFAISNSRGEGARFAPFITIYGTTW
jgi:SAM-dependent methyltransferase